MCWWEVVGTPWLARDMSVIMSLNFVLLSDVRSYWNWSIQLTMYLSYFYCVWFGS